MRPEHEDEEKVSARTTIDFGIHLGIRYAEIAVLHGMVADIIKNNQDDYRTPCAVFIDKRGQVQVGQRAKNRQEDQNTADDLYVEFLRRMGTDHRYEFMTSGRTMRPEELTAEVLKSLRADVQQRLGEDIHAAVITVPAAFAQQQCEATKKAGELAGLTQCPLIQEPVAAVLAYGFQADAAKGFWLVYDFGGETFDATIIKAEDGSISVVNHGGDNYLGGSDMDWAIIDQLVIPELTANFNLPDFSRGNKKWRAALAVIKRSVEEAKIQLSRSDTAYLEMCNFKDADGEMIEVDYKLTRDALITVTEPIISRSVEICKRVLKEKNLWPSAIAKVILVGGPTLAPYFREILHSNLEIQLDHSVDPLTVLAKGAAVFAGTQRLETLRAPEVVKPPQYRLDLKYKPMGPDEDPTVHGEVKSASGTSVEGFTVEFVNQKTQWRSGKVPLKSDGRFKVNLLAEKKVQNVFTIRLFNPVGRSVGVVPHSLTYTIGAAALEPPIIIHSIGIALANNAVDVLFRMGEPLPAKATRLYPLAQGVRKGDKGDLLGFLVVEGEQDRADRNMKLGRLSIRGADLRQDIPAGSEVEVNMHIDASRIMRVKAYIPVLDEEFEAVIDFNNRSPNAQQLQREYDEEMRRFFVLREAFHGKTQENLPGAFRLEEISRLIGEATNDPDAACKADRMLLELKIALDECERRVQ